MRFTVEQALSISTEVVNVMGESYTGLDKDQKETLKVALVEQLRKINFGMTARWAKDDKPRMEEFDE